MAEKYEKETKKQEKSEYETEYKKDYESDWEVHKNVIQSYDPFEAMLLGQVYDSVSNTVDGSKITDNYAATLAKERADRVIAKLPEGETQSAGKADVGKAAFMDILRQKWIYPNANAQHPLVEKLAMWQLGSDEYGWYPMFYDWTVSNTGYVGPDCWLWSPRNFIPQQGRISIQDMDYATALTWISKERLEDIIDNEVEGDGWNRDALKELVDRYSNRISGNDNDKNTFVERDRNPSGVKKGICLATRYEAGPDGNWCTFAPDDGFIEVRRLANPHKNGRIPFVIKYSQPLPDSFYGIGSFQLDKPLQFARDGLTNFYFANLKRNLAPGIIVNVNGVVKHTLDVTKANPVLMETIPNSIRPIPTNTAGLSTYQAAMSGLTGAMLARNGSQNASIPGAEALNPSQGKTPAAINLYSDKEATTDGAARRRMETAIEQLTDGFFSLVANIGTEDIPVQLFYEDIKAIKKAGYEDVMGLFTTDPFTGEQEIGSPTFKPDATMSSGDLIVKPGVLKGVEYRFSIAPNSTMQVNKEKQLSNLRQFIGDLSGFQNIFKDDPRIELHPEKIAEAFGGLADIENANEFITVKDAPSPEEQKLIDENNQLKEQMAQLQQERVMKEMDAKIGELGTAQEQAAQPQKITNATGMYNDPTIASLAESVTKL